MAEKMMEYIRSQPLVWGEACRLLEGPACAAAADLLQQGMPLRVVMIGSGSSLYAAQAAAELLQAADGPEFFAVPPTRLGPFARPRPGTVYWAVSQSGKSTSTEGAVLALRAAGARVWALTAEAASPLARSADGHLLIPCGQESVGPKTKGMTCTVLALWLLGMALSLGGRRPELRARAEALFPTFCAAEQNLALCAQWAQNCLPAVRAAHCLTLVAEGPALPLAQEGALKLLETLYIPASAWEFEEYLHGVNNIIGPGQVHLFLLRGGKNRARMERLLQYCEARGAVCLTVDCSPPRPGVAGCRLGLGCTGLAEALPYEALPAFQVLSALGSEARGIDCDRPRYPDFYAALGTKLGAK